MKRRTDGRTEYHACITGTSKQSHTMKTTLKLMQNFNLSWTDIKQTEGRTEEQVPYITGNLKHSHNEDTVCRV